MSDQILKTFKALGLTPWQLVIGCALVWGWITTLMPVPMEMAKLNDTVSRLGTKVEIHGILIAQITELNNEVKGMRRELSTIEGRLAHSNSYNSKSRPEPE
jgi:hypothetical protein